MVDLSLGTLAGFASEVVCQSSYSFTRGRALCAMLFVSKDCHDWIVVMV